MSRLFNVFFIFFNLGTLSAQSYTLETVNQNQHRNLQLLGELDTSISFTVQSNSIFKFKKANWTKPSISILPLVLTQQFNSHHPFGWNDGVMLFAKGYQVFARPGININYGIFELQAAPELLFASNSNYPTNSQFGNPQNYSQSKIFPGQSYLKAHIGGISFGISSEHMWWGPGIQSSLLMSNNAPGFLHAFIGTRKPINTFIGSFEFNLIGARLSSNKNLSYESFYLRSRKISDDWRYLNSFVISWQPRWVKGLFLGVTRSMQEFGDQAFNRSNGFLKKYLPVVLSPAQKINNFADDTLNRDQLASFFLRWVFTKHQAEFYLEYGKNDYGVNIRDYLNAPTHSAAYTVGFRKLLTLSSSRYIQLETEFTQMSQSPDYLVRGAGNWYEHGQLLQGYTNNNQIMGSRFGTNVQTFSATWVKGNLRNGFLIQRLEVDPVYRSNKWTDISIGWMPQWQYKKMLIGAKLQFIRSNNYIWEKDNNPFNLHTRLMVQYNLK